jgi:hypothetical protein
MARSALKKEGAHLRPRKPVRLTPMTAGLRDHADEDADFGMTADDTLHLKGEGRIPRLHQA